MRRLRNRVRLGYGRVDVAVTRFDEGSGGTGGVDERESGIIGVGLRLVLCGGGSTSTGGCWEASGTTGPGGIATGGLP
jgi:hypothetical protein